VAEVPEGGAELERVARCAPGSGLAVGDHPGKGLMQFLSAQRRAKLDDALDLARPGVSLGVRDTGRDDDRLARSGDAFLPVEGEVGFAGQDDESFFLARMDVLGDHPTRDAAPREADQLPVIVIAAGRSDWVLPSIVITIGPLLLWLDHLVHIRRYRVIGWALTAGPVVLVATMSGSSLAVTTGMAAGVILLGTAAAGFHDLATIRAARQQGPPSAGTKR
jgi:hypothetical protein